MSAQLKRAKQLAAQDPLNPAAQNNLGLVLRKAGRYAEAAKVFTATIKRSPDYAKAHYNLGLTLLDQRHIERAAQSFVRATSLDPLYVKALFALARSFRMLDRDADADAALLRILSIAPTNTLALLERAELLSQQKKAGDAEYLFKRVLALEPANFAAWYGMGSFLFGQFRFADAFTAFSKACDLDARHLGVRASRMLAATEIANWDFFDADSLALHRLLDEGQQMERISITQALRLPTTAAQQKAIAARQAREVLERLKLSGARLPAPAKPSLEGRKIRLGYVSGDFREHALMHLMGSVFRLHDRSRFHVTAYSYGPDDDSAMRKQVIEQVDRFVELRDRSDLEAASCIRQHEIDLLIDLTGLSMGGRPAIMGLRPAPVQISLVGFAASMGQGLVDILIGDDTVAPKGSESEFCESLLRMPHSYLATDHRQRISDTLTTRASCELPEDALVLASFNTIGKIDPHTFSLWMRLLKAVPNCVLWQYAHGREFALARQNLQKAARAAGVDPARIVFADLLPKAEHLARLQLANLALDTPMCNGHTTTVDALWAGVPVLAMRGHTFATRVSASLLRSAGLPQNVADDANDYEQKALQLLRDPAQLASQSRLLQTTRDHSNLFHTPTYVTALEQLYQSLATGSRSIN
tara:strand:+ start:1533 stop:3461 length:1929 start_codon:yes stop_codon:yes gene_type:complete